MVLGLLLHVTQLTKLTIVRRFDLTQALFAERKTSPFSGTMTEHRYCRHDDSTVVCLLQMFQAGAEEQ